MSRVARAVIIFSIGLTCGRLVLSGGFSNFVQVHMRIPLAAASIVMVLIGGIEILNLLRTERNLDKVWSAPAIGVVLVAPLIVLTSVAPTGLGALAASRSDSLAPSQTSADYEPLVADASGVADIRHSDFLSRALYDRKESLKGRKVRLTGIVVKDPTIPDGFMVTRFMVSCCAADGRPMKIAVRGVDKAFDNDEWVEVIGVWRPLPEADKPTDSEPQTSPVEVDAISVAPMKDPPESPYETPY
jgi:uncharacterized repeat protein (TIGR03943 family)